MKEAIVKISKTESWFFEKIKHTFSQIHQEKKKREESNEQN